ncbi:hypothetical protein IE53DRAFT_221017 [Violaceomyces palustris]|uniref:Uncharacterized protein n=1 Tax=Violaceomyces palustris TaxID=1673888 RepID=A0ACD0NQ79_9BASI|nr:hypothetical protein IE53DRAFT_221017 [Violaceomyces palustris]
MFASNLGPLSFLVTLMVNYVFALECLPNRGKSLKADCLHALEAIKVDAFYNSGTFFTRGDCTIYSESSDSDSAILEGRFIKNTAEEIIRRCASSQGGDYVSGHADSFVRVIPKGSLFADSAFLVGDWGETIGGLGKKYHKAPKPPGSGKGESHGSVNHFQERTDQSLPKRKRDVSDPKDLGVRTRSRQIRRRSKGKRDLVEEFGKARVDSIRERSSSASPASKPPNGTSDRGRPKNPSSSVLIRDWVDGDGRRTTSMRRRTSGRSQEKRMLVEDFGAFIHTSPSGSSVPGKTQSGQKKALDTKPKGGKKHRQVASVFLIGDWGDWGGWKRRDLPKEFIPRNLEEGSRKGRSSSGSSVLRRSQSGQMIELGKRSSTKNKYLKGGWGNPFGGKSTPGRRRNHPKDFLPRDLDKGSRKGRPGI